MSFLGKVRIGQKAPDFQCEAVVNNEIEGQIFLAPSTISSVSFGCLTNSQKSPLAPTSVQCRRMPRRMLELPG